MASIKYYLGLPKPSLSDNTADADRLRRGFKQAGFEEVIVPHQAIGPASRVLWQAGRRVTASLRERTGGWRLIQGLARPPEVGRLGPVGHLGGYLSAFFLLGHLFLY